MSITSGSRTIPFVNTTKGQSLSSALHPLIGSLNRKTQTFGKLHELDRINPALPGLNRRDIALLSTDEPGQLMLGQPCFLPLLNQEFPQRIVARRSQRARHLTLGPQTATGDKADCRLV